MLLTEEHAVRYRKKPGLFRKIDDYCARAKALYNSVNYLICQSARISRKLSEGEIPDSWEKGLIYRLNCAVYRYNRNRKHKLAYIDENNGFIADAYFLSWYLKDSTEYKAMPYATCAQICIQNLCSAWKAFYRGMKAWKKHPETMLGRPAKPGYRDKEKGRQSLVLTWQNIRVDDDGNVRFPRFLEGLTVRARHKDVRQVSIITDERGIRIRLIYRQEEQPFRKGGVMGIDLGVNNLAAICMDTEAHPVLLDGRAVKSINRYYNKRKAILQSLAMRGNGRHRTKRIQALTGKRNRKIKDYMHKASRKIIQIAQAQGIGLIIIGNNRGWKQKAELGNRTNQAFVSIPYRMLIEQISYKAALAGIKVEITGEEYTSGTSYVDNEPPVKEYYDKNRRIARGLFRGNNGTLINADVNAAYQIMKKAGHTTLCYKGPEKAVRLKVS